MPMGRERSNALHNFKLPIELRWGNQKFLRCVKLNSNRRNNCNQQLRTTRDRQMPNENDFLNTSRRRGTESVGGRRFSDENVEIAAVREKMMLDLQKAANKMKESIFLEGLDEGEISGSSTTYVAAETTTVEGEIQKPWNLRTRRATAVGGYNDCVGEGLKIHVPKPHSGSSQQKSEITAVSEKSSRLRIGGTAAAAGGDKRCREKFSVALQKSDIEGDFMVMVGHRPPRRPKKRAKIVQKQLDTLFPGLWLTEVTADMYQVSELSQ